ncbi:hypothetical protein GCM10007979_31970 [Nocardioides albus]|nr:hypothetical protein GCM10007979_31970 [Nocardioides albus]
MYDLTDEEAGGDQAEDDEGGAVDSVAPIRSPLTFFEQRGAAHEPRHAVRSLQKAEDEKGDGIRPGRGGCGLPDQAGEQPDDGTETSELDPYDEKHERLRRVPEIP